MPYSIFSVMSIPPESDIVRDLRERGTLDESRYKKYKSWKVRRCAFRLLVLLLSFVASLLSRGDVQILALGIFTFFFICWGVLAVMRFDNRLFYLFNVGSSCSASLGRILTYVGFPLGALREFTYQVDGVTYKTSGRVNFEDVKNGATQILFDSRNPHIFSTNRKELSHYRVLKEIASEKTEETYKGIFSG